MSSVLIRLKDACLAVRSGSDRVAGGGFVHVTRWQKSGSAPHTDRTQPQAPGRGRAPTDLEQRLVLQDLHGLFCVMQYKERVVKISIKLKPFVLQTLQLLMNYFKKLPIQQFII